MSGLGLRLCSGVGQSAVDLVELERGWRFGRLEITSYCFNKPFAKPEGRTRRCLSFNQSVQKLMT